MEDHHGSSLSVVNCPVVPECLTERSIVVWIAEAP